MESASPYFDYRQEPDAVTISLKRNWTFGNATELEGALREVPDQGTRPVTFQCGGLQDLDIAGAWILFRKAQQFEAQGRATRFQGFKAAHFKFLKNITDAREGGVTAESAVVAGVNSEARLSEAIESLGRAAAASVEDLGRIATAILEGIVRPSRLAFAETVRQIEHTGMRAVPIVSLIAFLTGVVLAYQGAIQLATFGAEVFVADLVTVSMFREMGALMAGIMAAGRSGSAFAASIGVMKLNEEIDALRVMGLNPNQVLIAPRVVGLLISLPLLTMVAILSGILGGLVLSTLVLDMSALQYVERTSDAAEMGDLFVGVAKAPVFAVLIAAVGTLRGMQVTSSAAQLGRLTTTAVVQSVFLIVLADAVFTIVFASVGI